MIKRFLYAAALVLICSGSLKAQDPKTNFLQAYEAYQGGDYSGSLGRINAVEKQLGRTNPKIQSLKTMIYYEQGDVNRALLELGLYFRTSPDKTSSEYESMLSLYQDLQEESKARQDNARKELEKNRQLELQEAEKEINAEKDQFYYKVAREAGTIEAYELFLKKNSTLSLKETVETLLAEEKKKKDYETLVTEGLKLMNEGAPLRAIEKFKSAQKMQASGWLHQQLSEAGEYAADIAWSEGNKDLLEGRWKAAADNFKLVLDLRNFPEAKSKLHQAQDEAAYAAAERSASAQAFKAYLQKYPQGLRKKAAEGFLLRHYIDAASQSLAAHQSAEVKMNLQEARGLQSAEYWSFFKDDYYKLVLREAEYLSSGSKKQKMQNILPAIAYYEELNQGSGKNYNSKLRSLRWKDKDWNRPDMIYVAYSSDVTFNEMGFVFGSNSTHGIGINTSVRGNLQGLSTKDFKHKGMDYVKGMVNLNLTKRIIYPLWIYAGGGYTGFQTIVKSSEDPSKGYLGDVTIDTFNMAAGVSIHLKPVYLSAGSSFPYLNAKQNAQLGFTKSPSYFNVAIGLGW